jgi:hypothetical protein
MDFHTTAEVMVSGDSGADVLDSQFASYTHYTPIYN